MKKLIYLIIGATMVGFPAAHYLPDWASLSVIIGSVVLGASGVEAGREIERMYPSKK